ncbi:RAP protein, putative [Plasmodium vivax]|nr:RAP protein, putative [Plasmodium vivax]
MLQSVGGSPKYFSHRTIFNAFKRSLSNAKENLIDAESRKIEKTLLYMEQCIAEENEQNGNLLNFKTVCNREDKLKGIHMNLVKMSYMLKNMRINEQKWLAIYKQISGLHPLDEGLLRGKANKRVSKMEKMDQEKDNFASEKLPPNRAVHDKFSREYNLLNLTACYVFLFKVSMSHLMNCLWLYRTSNYLLILNCCAEFFHFFFNLHRRKGIQKLNFIYLHSGSHNYAENVKNLKSKSNQVIRCGENSTIAYHYEELYNLKYHQIVTCKINLMTRVLENLNYGLLDGVQLAQLANFFCFVTKCGVVSEKGVHHFLSYCWEVAKKEASPSDEVVPKEEVLPNGVLFSQLVNAMYYSKIVHSELASLLASSFRRVSLDSPHLCRRGLFDSCLKLLTLVKLTDQNMHLYAYCKHHILTGDPEDPTYASNVCNFLFVSSIVGLFNPPLMKFYVNFLKKKKDKATFKNSTRHKIYYTLLGWDIVLNRFIKRVTEERRETIDLAILNFESKSVHYLFSNKVLYDFSDLSHQINYLTLFFKNKIMLKKEGKNYYLSQTVIFHMLKKHYGNAIYEYVTNEKIPLDVYVNLRTNDQQKNVAIEFNGRTHYVLVLSKGGDSTDAVHYTMRQNCNTKYKMWILSNLNFYTISVSYYFWNGLHECQKERHLLHAMRHL